MKSLIVFGTRPEAIKMAPLVHELSTRGDSIDSLVCITGQHREMLDEVLRIFSITPDFDLNVIRTNPSLTEIASAVQNGLNEIITAEQPNIILVHGDTTTSVAAALAGFYNKVPIGHIEAGLRTGNIHSPWPEEANRRIISTIATHHFAPTASASRNLLLEGVKQDSVVVTGNTVIDALNLVSQKFESDPQLKIKFNSQFPYLATNVPFILVTAHRRENHGERLRGICTALIRIIESHPSLLIVFPVHPNPNVQTVVTDTLSGIDRVKLLPPVDYITFTAMLKRATLVLTDSGGLQEEGPALGRPVLVMRDTTERPEGLHGGGVKLIGTEPSLIVDATLRLLSNREEYDLMVNSRNPYGNGDASSRIVDYLCRLYN